MTKFANICHPGSEGGPMATLNISMPDAMREWIDAQVAGGDYANASDYIRDLIRHDQRERDAIRLALIEGESSGPSRRSVTDIARQAKRRLKRG
jgi:antitoxin ParD1/3/4